MPLNKGGKYFLVFAPKVAAFSGKSFWGAIGANQGKKKKKNKYCKTFGKKTKLSCPPPKSLLQSGPFKSYQQKKFIKCF